MFLPFRLFKFFETSIFITAVSSLTNEIEPRIWKGKEGNLAEHKWIVSVCILPPLEFLCGGSLVAPTWVLTLGHCTRYKNVSYWVRAGSDRIFEDGISVHVDSIYRLSDFKFIDPRDMITELALLKLDTGLLGDYIQPVKLPRESDFLNIGDKVNVIGWGLPGGPVETKPTRLPFRTISMSVVGFGKFMIFPLVWTTLFNITNLDFLLYGEYGNGACFRDVGSPVVRNGVLYGVIVPGHICDLKQLVVSVTTKVTPQVEWIKHIVGEELTNDKIAENVTNKTTY